MCRAKSIVHKNVAQRRHFAGQSLVIFLLTAVEAAVFQHDDLAGFHVKTINPVRHQRDFALHEFTQALSHRCQ